MASRNSFGDGRERFRQRECEAGCGGKNSHRFDSKGDRMQRIGIDYYLVADAAEKLKSQGEAPTIDRVRVILGTGSNTTISKYLHQWRNTTAQGNKTEHVSSMTPPDPVQLAVKRVWQQLREETDAEIEEIKASTQAIIDESEEKVAAMTKEGVRLAVLSEGYKEQARLLEAKSAMQQVDLNQLQREHDLLQERNKNLAQRYTDLELTMAKQHADLVQAHHNEMNLVIEKSNAQVSTYEKLIDQQKRHTEDQRNDYMLETDRLKTHQQKIRKDYELLQAVTASKDVELVELKTQLNALKKENENFSTQLQSQEKYWGFFEKNSQVTNNILSELKDIPKFDFSLPYINLINDMQSNINFSMENLGKVTDDAKQTIELFKNFSMNADKNE